MLQKELRCADLCLRMFYCRNPKFVYLDCSRCGSTSVLNHLGSHYKLERYGPRRHGIQVPMKMRDWTKFTVVRNPYNRMASVFWMKYMNGRTGPSFEEWLNRIDPWKWAQCRFARLADHVFKIEKIEEARALDFWPDTPFPHRHDSKTKEWTRVGTKWRPIPDKEKLLTDSAKKIIRKRFRGDFKECGYRL